MTKNNLREEFNDLQHKVYIRYNQLIKYLPEDFISNNKYLENLFNSSLEHKIFLVETLENIVIDKIKNEQKKKGIN